MMYGTPSGRYNMALQGRVRIPVAHPVLRPVPTRIRTLKSAGGQPIPVEVNHDVKVSGANITQTDIAADNGVIHVIDHVIMPR